MLRRDILNVLQGVPAEQPCDIRTSSITVRIIKPRPDDLYHIIQYYIMCTDQRLAEIIHRYTFCTEPYTRDMCTLSLMRSQEKSPRGIKDIF